MLKWWYILKLYQLIMAKMFYKKTSWMMTFLFPQIGNNKFLLFILTLQIKQSCTNKKHLKNKCMPVTFLCLLWTAIQNIIPQEHIDMWKQRRNLKKKKKEKMASGSVLCFLPYPLHEYPDPRSCFVIRFWMLLCKQSVINPGNSDSSNMTQSL